MRHELRALRRQPGFVTAVVATLALGIGLNTAIFAVVNTLLFRPPPAVRGDGLYWVVSGSRKPGGPAGHLTYEDYADIRSLGGVVVDAAAFQDAPVSLSAGGQAIRATGQIVTTNFFDVIGVRPSIGRAWRPGEDRSPSAVVSHGIWQRLFSGDPAVVGRTVVINGEVCTVAGVAPQGFGGLDPLMPADVWVPIGMHARVVPDVSEPFGRSAFWLRAVARLAPSVPASRAAAALTVVADNIARSHPASHEGLRLGLRPVRGVPPSDRSEVTALSALLLGITLCVLFIASANIANLTLIRNVARRREIGVRLALGAGRGRVLRQLVTESLILAGCGAAAGLLVAMWATDLLMWLVNAPLASGFTPDARVLAFVAAAALAAAALFGLAPAWRASRADVARELNAAAIGVGGSPRVQRALVAGQLAISLVLLASAGSLVRGLAAARTVDVGFATTDRVSVAFHLGLQGYDVTRAAAFYRRLLEDARAVAGVRSASLATVVPMSGRVYFTDLTLPDRPADPDEAPLMVAYNHVWPHFFETLGIPVVRGRALDERDLTSPPAAAVVSEEAARRFWPDREPLGQRFRLQGPDGPALEVVGVARDLLLDEFTEQPRPYVYLPPAAEPGETALVAWVTGDRGSVLRALSRRVAELDPNLPMEGRTIEDHLRDRMDGERGLTTLLGISAALALALAAFGLYGAMAFTVTRRTREIGLRMALGADRVQVRRQFLREGLRLGALGAAIGLPPAIGVTVLLAGTLVGVGPVEPLPLAGAALLLAVVTLAAGLVPAQRASRVDPMLALRCE
jgi:predicted permease